ncbi:transposase (plasmid) [Fischerella sp. NIES-4106]|nr:transposase [Fischerella sp. NIES-4106]
MSQIENAKIKNIDHLGIVAGLIDEIGIVEVVPLLGNRSYGKLP